MKNFAFINRVMGAFRPKPHQRLETNNARESARPGKIQRKVLNLTDIKQDGKRIEVALREKTDPVYGPTGVATKKNGQQVFLWEQVIVDRATNLPLDGRERKFVRMQDPFQFDTSEPVLDPKAKIRVSK